jgi:hypothetical protein
MLPPELRERKQRLQHALNELTGAPEIVRSNALTLENGEAAVRFQHSVRLRPALLRLVIWEEFRNLDTEPYLYAFSYHVAGEDDVRAERPLFRYECHPDIGDPVPPNDQGDTVDFRNPYERDPHFHPDNTRGEHVSKLHYPFHRAERKTVVFALVQWLRVDLIRRFHQA